MDVERNDDMLRNEGMPKVNRKRKPNNITLYDGVMEERIEKEYTTDTNGTQGTMNAPYPNRDKLFQTMALFDRDELQYTNYPEFGDGGILMELTQDTNREILLNNIEKLYGKDDGGVCIDTAVRIVRNLSMTHNRESTRARLCTVIEKSVYVFDWIVAKDTYTGERKVILTWIPLKMDNPITDKYSRKWITPKSWKDYNKEEKKIFRMNRIMLRINHLWILQKNVISESNKTMYKIMKNSFVIIIPTMLRFLCPDINTNLNDVAIQKKIDTTNNINDVLAERLIMIKYKPSRYDQSQIETPLINKVIGKKYDGAKRAKEEEMILDTSITDNSVRNELLSCHSYTICTKIEEKYYKYIEKVLEILSDKLEATPEILEIMNKLTEKKKTYHILGFLSNASIWFRYGYDRNIRGISQIVNKPHWMPLSYKFDKINNPRCYPQFNDISPECAEEITRMITGHNIYEINPRYIAIAIKSPQGYRIINNQIYDIYNYKKEQDDDILLDDNNINNQYNKRQIQEIYEISPLIQIQYNENSNDININVMNKIMQKDKNLKMIEISQNEEIKDIQLEINQNEENENNKLNDESKLNMILCPKNKKSPELYDKSIQNNDNESTENYEEHVEISSDCDDIEEPQEKHNINEIQNDQQKINNNEDNDTNIQIDIDNNRKQDILNEIRTINIIENMYFHEIIIRKQNFKNNFQKEHFQGYNVIQVTKDNKITKKEDIKPKENVTIDLQSTKLVTNKKKPKKAKRKIKNNSIHMLGNVHTIPLMTQNKACPSGKTRLAETNFFPKLLTPTKITKDMPFISDKTNEKKETKRTKKTNKTIKNTVTSSKNGINRTDKNIENLQKNKNMKKNDKRYIPTNIVPKSITAKKIIELNDAINGIKNKNPYNNVEYWLKLTQVIQSQIQKSQQSYNDQNGTIKKQSKRVIEERANREFKKGNIGKAFQTVMMENKTPIIPTEKQLNTLFKGSTMKPIEINDKVQMFVVTLPMLEMTMKTMKNGKGVGISMLSSEHVRQLISNEKQMEFLRTTIQSLINNPTKVPSQTYKSKLICIKKESGGIRPLCIEETILKIANKIVNAAILPHVNRYIDNAQKCLNGTNSQMNAVEALKKEINNGKKKKYITQIDLTNAFGTIEYNAIIEELIKIESIKNIVPYIAQLLRNKSIEYMNEKGEMKERKLSRGVPQGDPLSMTLFAVAINKVIREINHMKEFKRKSNPCKIVCYADDVIIVTSTKEEMNKVKNIFEEKASLIGLETNKNKTKHYVTSNKDEDEYKNLHSNNIEFLGIPISLNQEKISEYVSTFLEQIYEQAKILWSSKTLTLQTKYHMHRTCLLSRAIYMFRGTDTNQNIKEISEKIEKLYIDIFNIPKELMRLPVSIGGMGMLYLDDMRQVSRLSYLIEIGEKEIPDALKPFLKVNEKIQKGEIQHKISTAYFKRKKEMYLGSNNNTDKNIAQMLDEKQTSSAHSLLMAPPTNPTQAFDDVEFRILIALRYHIDITKHSELECMACDKHETSLWHILGCRIGNAKTRMYIHERVKLIIGHALAKNKNVLKVTYEQYAEDQDRDTHRPDIVLSLANGKQDVIDVCVDSKFQSKLFCGLEPTAGVARKEKQYKSTEVKAISFDNSGRINSKSLAYLKLMGISKGIIKYIQCVIIKSNAYVLKDLCKKQKEASTSIDRRHNIHLDEEMLGAMK